MKNESQTHGLESPKEIQGKNPARGDWVSSCLTDLTQLGIKQSLKEIKIMNQTKFKNIVKERIKIVALDYLLEKQGSKGSETKYTNIQMAEYLQPYCSKLNIDEKRQMFAVKNRMVDLPVNFPAKNIEVKCICGSKETMSHIYSCKSLNKTKEMIKYEQIYEGNITEQIEIFKRFQQNLETRNKLNEIDKLSQQSPCDPKVDPLIFVKTSNG